MHTGSILGLPGRIIVFLASLIIASLPVTGFIIWWRKKKKRRK
ncbi:MAG: PepSY domain-containing protein [Bacteroides graminisolvens]|nr:PepSY domain-containing protein [Bacteroides graminisolvens]